MLAILGEKHDSNTERTNKSMKANEANLLTLLDGTKQFILPIYQRRYSWEWRHCQQLWDDIVRIGEDEDLPYHFFGSLVSRVEGTATKQEFFVIDGQQRLATFSLLLAALGRALEVNNVEISTDKGKIEDSYLFNPRERDEFRYKLLLTEYDRNTLIQLLEGGEVSDNGSLLVKTYNFFTRKLRPDNLETVYKGIQKLMIVDIVLDSSVGNPQLIFESLNSKGLELSQADLIRNYVLMVQERDFQNRLYRKHWCPMEESFGEEHSKRFDSFMRDYLILKTGQVPPKKKVYESFKRHVPDPISQPRKLEEKIRDIAHYSTHYVRIALSSEDDPKLCACLFDLHELKAEASYPILLGVYEGYTQGRIEKADVIEIFRLIESYTVRRLFCELPTKSVHKIFGSIAKKFDSGSSLQEMKDNFSQLSHPDQFPSNQEFKEAFLKKDVYTSRALRNYLLRKLENHERKETIDVESYTIEHVMPRSLTGQWKADLGENWENTHEIYLNTIGNLTLTGYNSELSNRSFQEKRDHVPGGFRDSPLHLNKSLAQAERWDEAAIKKRAETLLEKALKIWIDHGIDKPIRRGWSLDDHHHLSGEMMGLFQQLQNRIQNLDDSAVSEQITQHYIGYRLNTYFVCILPRASCLLLYLNLPFLDINDPQGLCRDVTNIGHLGSGDVEVAVSSTAELDNIMFLIGQAFESQSQTGVR